MIIFAHRGASGYAPENTLAAMKKAIELGARAIEFDIHNVEGELYVFHDRRLDNKSNGTGLIEEVSRSYLDSLRVDGEPIPTLWQVMSYLNQHNCLVNIELKGMNCLEIFIDTYPKLINQLNFSTDKLIISSFHHGFLATFRQRFPQALLAPLFEGVALNSQETTSRLDAYSLHLSLSFLTQDCVTQAQSRGLKVFVYTVDNESDMTQLQKMGVDGIFTNFPDRAMKALQA
ncbi:glycerophosphodiester phosphodiesterase [Shewanella psychropiezotolerans]|uniref:Glycerophosphodiester phosphodiesterase n=1 Tax=Shewanella psychropiezotolerans TaxID=2593655 RepID=A0ABX5WZR2_9GAMM|nr:MULTISPECIES: glycerophosphodiester phosphodiesterase family protein [Shewanella]MPY25213.1 glycerophosphodiester phosphodiesterase [Shewanella sp. YLB-07]QDO82491.1 glycerophosphodiester phosphodiesterase [Shewanella psychropiezotolerans]